MKKKEVEVFITRWALDRLIRDEPILMNSSSYICSGGGDEFNNVKATLTIEIPDREITITESQFNEAWVKVFGSCNNGDMEDVRGHLFKSEE